MSSLTYIRRRELLSALVVAGVAVGAFAQESGRRVPVTFAAGKTTRAFEDEISEYEAVSYVVPLRQGQLMRVVLTTNNASNCFDVYAPNTPKPVHVGADFGSTLQLRAEKTGDHEVKVFLLRMAARDGQSARYTLEIAVTG